jgi:hypothetical protein
LRLSEDSKIVLDDPAVRHWFEGHQSQAALDDKFTTTPTQPHDDDIDTSGLDWDVTHARFQKRIQKRLMRDLVGKMLRKAGVENWLLKRDLFKSYDALRKMKKKELVAILGVEDAEKVRMSFSDEKADEKKERLAAQQAIDNLARDLLTVPNGGSNHVVPPPIVPPPPPIVPENQMIEDKFNNRGNKGIEILNLNTNADGKKEKTHVGYIQSNELYPIQNQPGAIKALKRKVYNAGLPSALKALKNKQKKELKSAEKKKRKSDSGAGASGGGKKRRQTGIRQINVGDANGPDYSGPGPDCSGPDATNDYCGSGPDCSGPDATNDYCGSGPDCSPVGSDVGAGGF